MKVVHLTSCHPVFDNRVFYKECRSMAAAGFDVVYVVPHHEDLVVDGVRIHAIPKPTNRIQRVFTTILNVYDAAIREDADLYHFHDPELAIVGMLLRARGKPVIYDIHEDYYTSIKQKTYMNPLLRPVLARLCAAVEDRLPNFFDIVLAERYYAKRFPMGHNVLNYPIIDHFQSGPTYDPSSSRRPRLLYTGFIGEDRGVFHHANIVNLVPDVEVHMIGMCGEAVATKAFEIAGDNGDRLIIEGVGEYVPHQRILDKYNQGGWLAGLAVFPQTPHYYQKELTKFYEYMTNGMPTICSDFPVWKSLVQDNGFGLCVNPSKPDELASAITRLIDHPDQATAISDRGRQAVQDEYNWDTQANALAALYRRILEGRSRA